MNHWLTTNLLTCQTPAGLKHFKLSYNFNCRKTQVGKYFVSLLVRKTSFNWSFDWWGRTFYYVRMRNEMKCILLFLYFIVESVIFESIEIYKCEVTKNRCLCLVCLISGDYGVAETKTKHCLYTTPHHTAQNKIKYISKAGRE